MASHGDLSPELKKLREKHQHFYLSVYTSTDAVVNHYICGGGLDLGLNEEGIEDARKLAKRFQKNPLKIKKIITSVDMSYAREVADKAMQLSTAEQIDTYLKAALPAELHEYLV